MQITVDGEDLFEITPTEIELLEYVLISSEVNADCKRRLKWVLTHKISQIYKHLKNEWMPILEADPEVTQVPIDNEAFFNMVKVRPDYKDRDAKDAETAAEITS